MKPEFVFGIYGSATGDVVPTLVAKEHLIRREQAKVGVDALHHINDGSHYHCPICGGQEYLHTEQGKVCASMLCTVQPAPEMLVCIPRICGSS